MEGLYFEVSPRDRKPSESRLTSNHHSCPALLNLTSSEVRSEKCDTLRKRTSSWVEITEGEEEEVQYKLRLMGSLPVHHLTTMTMLPWVVAEITKTKKGRYPGVKRGASGGDGCQSVLLCVSASWVRCVSIIEEGVEWDPLRHTVLFKCHPHQVTKLLHNSQEPSSFGFLVKGTSNCACFVFQCNENTKVCVHSNLNYDDTV